MLRCARLKRETGGRGAQSNRSRGDVTPLRPEDDWYAVTTSEQNGRSGLDRAPLCGGGLGLFGRHGIDEMRWSDVNFRREAWWLLLLAALVPLGLLAASLLWTR